MNHVFDQGLDRDGSANDHEDAGEEEDEPVEELDSAGSLLPEETEMHEGGEDESSDIISEVSNNRENVSEVRHEVGDDGDEDDLDDAEEDVDGVGDEDAALGAGAPVALDHLVHRLHPQREPADHRDHHQQVHRDRDPRAVRQRVHDVVLHLLRYVGEERRKYARF